MSAAPHFNRIALIGFGLIGGSIARAAREQGLVGEIVTTARSAKTRARVSELGIVDSVVATNAEAVEDADGDGRFDNRKVFAERLNLVSGLALGVVATISSKPVGPT